MEGDIQEQRDTFQACGQAAYRGWIMRLAGKIGSVAGALFLCFVFFPRRDAYGMGEQKKMKTGLRTAKSRVYCSLRGLHYPRHLKNNAFFAKIKRSPVKFNFQGHPTSMQSIENLLLTAEDTVNTRRTRSNPFDSRRSSPFSPRLNH